MPNWCSNAMAVYGPKDDVVKFVQIVREGIVNAGEYNQLYSTFLAAGFSKEEIDALPDFSRGFYTEMHPEVETDSEGAYAKIYFESAWSPLCDSWDALLRRFFPTLRQVTIADECGCEVYVNTDAEGRFFPDRYNVDACVEGEDGESYLMDYDDHTFETLDGALATVNAWLARNGFGPFDSIEQVEEWFEGRSEDHECEFFHIHEYSDY